MGWREIGRAWARAFGTPVKPATARVLALWARYKGYDREDFIGAAISDAAKHGGDDPVGHIIALFRAWRGRGIEEVAELEE